MKVYIICNEKNYILYPNRKYRLGNRKECDIYVEESIEEVLIRVKNDRVIINNSEYFQGTHNIKLGGLELGLLILTKSTNYLLDRKNVLIDSTDVADICFKEIKSPVLISYEEETKIVSEGYFYLNGNKTTGNIALKESDEIVFLEGLSIQLLGSSLSLFSNTALESDMITYDEDEQYENRAEEFHRSPRIILREPTDKVTVGTPPMEEEESRQSLLRLLMMPSAMIFFTILMYIYSSSGAMMIMMFGMSTVTIITSIHSYVSDRKKFKERQQKKVKDYKEYLEEKQLEFATCKEEQKQSLEHHYPDMNKILQMPKEVDRRIYEKTPYYFDFLTYRLGTGEVEPSFSIEYSKSETSKVKEEVVGDINNLLSHYRNIPNVPVKGDIHVPTGYIGTRKIAIEQIQQLMMQIAVFHSYHDAQFIPIFREDELNLWNWSRWLPHIQISAFNSRGFIYNQQTRDQLLTSLYQITVVDYRNDKKGILILHKGEYVNKEFLPSDLISLLDKENFARELAGINHEETLRNSIPNSVTFLEMYGAKTIDELNILERWQQNEAYQTMAVPLGVRGRDDLLYLNLHEKAHGPHGLIAGTTGSGKSELIQSYILSLAVNYHPYEVAFLLIDYKGGGMANLFADLPHLVGTITNLDANQALRALVSIKAELKKRQRLFFEHDVNHINQYTKLYKQGEAKEPLPHLFIISDEFAELKQEQPDFMQELISTARIGRSLGIHLILATQKPSGVVNDQIWSNSKFKIALKVQDVADSREIIKTPDAAQITQTGRAYLQVGNNEIYELFQSAWSGAEYKEDESDSDNRDLTIYEIRNNGQYIPINKDLSGLSARREIKSIPTQLDVIVEQTRKLFDKTGLAKVASPWLPPLKDDIYSGDIQNNNFKDYWGRKEKLTILVGYQDIPEKQEQSPLYLDMEKTGHIMLISSPGFGKTTFLQSIALDLMRKNTPEDVHIYLYDFGTSGLISISEFPHVADYFTVDEEEKITKSLKRLDEEVKRRKILLANAKVTNYTQYNEVATDSIPTIFMMIDSFDGMAEAKYDEAFISVLNTIARDGASLGIYIITTLSRMNAMRLQLQGNFKTKISLFLFDKSDLSAIVGRSNINLEEIKGRAVVKFDEIVHFQVVQAYKTQSYSEYINAIKEEINSMEEYWQGEKPERIPMLPEKITYQHIDAIFTDKDVDNTFVLGLYRDTAELATFTLDRAIMMASDKPTAIENYYTAVDYNLNRVSNEYKAYLFDSGDKVKTNYLSNIQKIINPLEIEEIVRELLTELEKRMSQAQEYSQKYLLIIPEIAAFSRDSRISEQNLKLLVKEGAKYGITVLFIGYYQDLVSNFDFLIKQIKPLVEQVYMGVRISDQDHTKYPYVFNEAYLKANEGYILTPYKYDNVQVIEE